MTPLAHRIVKELTLPVKDRSFADTEGLLRSMGGVHCFDCSAVLDLADQLDEQLVASGVTGRLAFLPAPKTWIEWIDAYGNRCGVLLEQDGAHARVRQAVSGVLGGSWFGTKRGSYLLPLLGDVSARDLRAVRLDAANGGVGMVWPPLLYAFLAIINSPRVIGRTQHMPHRGLEKKLASAKGLNGKFPLHAWTELKLSVADIGKRADGTVHEAHYTGEKCLHFCRAHVRIRNGKLELVSAHWRGNPALGIKRTRYKLTA